MKKEYKRISKDYPPRAVISLAVFNCIKPPPLPPLIKGKVCGNLHIRVSLAYVP